MDVRHITKIVKAFDSELRAECLKPPRIDIYRQSKLGPPHYIFSLTDDWSPKGRPVEWGTEPILAHLRAIDLWNSGVGIEEVIEHNEQVDESKDRARLNNIEAFLKDWRRQFAKTTDSINTGTLKKLDRRKEIENGYRKQGS